MLIRALLEKIYCQPPAPVKRERCETNPLTDLLSELLTRLLNDLLAETYAIAT